MPELPEVETARRGLSLFLEGCRLHEVDLRRPDLRVPLPMEMPQLLAGRRLEKIGRRAKYLLFRFEGGVVVLAHLGMSGRMVVHEDEVGPEKHDHVLWRFEGGRTMVFTDPRRFGLMVMTDDEGLKSHSLLAHLGPEPLEEEFTPAYLSEALQRRRGPVKLALMDQELVVGVGNIYASEGLFRAGIHPAKPANRISRERAARLHAAIRQVLLEAIESGGSTLRDHVQSTGNPGYLQHRFQVYSRAGMHCFSCKKSKVRQIQQGGRSTYFCPACQR